MTYDAGIKPEGAPERSPIAGGGAPSGVDANGAKRFSVQHKMAVVVRLLRGEPLELVARESNVTVAKLTDWRELVRRVAGASRPAHSSMHPPSTRAGRPGLRSVRRTGCG